MLLTSHAYAVFCVFHIRPISPIIVRRRTNQDPVTSLITSRRLRLFGHIARADPSQDHQRVFRAAINRLQADWQRQRGRPRWTWLRTVELNHTTSASTRRGSGHRTVKNGVNLWRRLCSSFKRTKFYNLFRFKI